MVDSKDDEIQAKCAELEQAKTLSAAELREAREMAEELKGTLE